jgi:integrase
MAERQKLTDPKVLALRPDGKGKRYLDAEVKGLVLFVSRTGTKTWRFRYRLGAEVKELTIGQFPGIERDVAVKQALAWQLAKADGHDPDRVQDRDRFVTDVAKTTVRTVIDAQLKKLDGRPSHYGVKKLYKDLLRIEGGTPVADFDGYALKRFLELNYSYRPGSARSLLRNLTAAYNHAAKSVSGIKLPIGFVNPAAKMAGELDFIRNAKRGSFARNFEEGDYQRLMKATQAAYGIEGVHTMGVAVIELALYTGARPDEIKSLKWSEVKGDLIVKEHHKNAHKGKQRAIHLFGPALKVLERAKEYRAKVGYEGPFVFPVRRTQANQKHPHVYQLTHYTQQISELTRSESAEPIKFVPYHLRSGFINFALDLLGEEFISIIAENVGHDVETCRRYYRRHREEQRASAAKKVSEAFERVMEA